MNLTILRAVSCVYFISSILRNHISFLSNAPHIIKLKFRKLKTLFECPQEMKLAKNPVFLHNFSKFMGIFLFVLKYIYISLLLKMINGFSWLAELASPYNIIQKVYHHVKVKMKIENCMKMHNSVYTPIWWACAMCGSPWKVFLLYQHGISDSCSQHVNCSMKYIFCATFYMHPGNDRVWTSILGRCNLTMGTPQYDRFQIGF